MSAPASHAKTPADPPTARPPGPAVFKGLVPDDQALLDKLLSEPADFVDHPEFKPSDAQRQLFGDVALLQDTPEACFADPTPAIEPREAGGAVPTLTVDTEQLLFKRFNYARLQVAKLLDRWATKRLSEPATRQLIAWGRRVYDTRAAIVQVNMPLVLAMAKRTRLGGIDFNELISEGNLALLRSVEKFDCGRGFKFSTYACRAILKSFSRVAMRASRYRSFFPTEFDANRERGDQLASKRDDVEQDCVDELKEILLGNLAGLSEVERTVIQERFAIGRPLVQGKPDSKTLEEVGHLIGVTKERVRQIQNKALKKIRSTLEERYLAA